MRRILVLLTVLGGCASAPKGVPDDATLSRFDHAGGIAFNQEQPDQAATQYRAALARARTRDDAAAIADAGFNLATAEMRAGQPRDAMRTAREMRAELARRGIVDPGFDLISATALFRLNDLAAADRAAAGLVGASLGETSLAGPSLGGPSLAGPSLAGSGFAPGKSPALANAAWFLRGLIADARRDRAGLERAAASMTAAADPGDVAELQARLAHDAGLALRAADRRRDALDYRGMARALALAGQFTPDTAKAADLYLRAGRSAAAQNDPANARLWLTEARKRSADPAVRTMAERGLHDLPGR